MAIQAGNQTLTAADPLPADLRAALLKIRTDGAHQFEASRGYPRAVNNLAVHALTAAFAAKSSTVDEKAARIAVTESGHE